MYNWQSVPSIVFAQAASRPDPKGPTLHRSGRPVKTHHTPAHCNSMSAAKTEAMAAAWTSDRRTPWMHIRKPETGPPGTGSLRRSGASARLCFAARGIARYTNPGCLHAQAQVTRCMWALHVCHTHLTCVPTRKRERETERERERAREGGREGEREREQTSSF